ncbi:hypothetical protein HWV62_17836 [Athelia sp. TMB]|nr:hypothetical protein HWV62_17836 [Athelia sp. TMB]
MFAHGHHHLVYWIPLFAAFIWFGTLFSMIITWKATGEPHYPSQAGSFPEISDVGASYLKPLFVTGGSITAVGFFLSLVFERWLRHSGRLLPNMRRRERVLSSLAILGAFIGGAGLILLTVFDTLRHHALHRAFLLVFILGVALSAIFTVLEYRWISRDFADVRKLRRAYVAKGAIAGVLIVLAVGFGVSLYEGAHRQSDAAYLVGAVLEWTIAFGFTLYLLTFYADLRMSKGVRRGELSRERLMHADGMAQVGRDGVPVGPGELGSGYGGEPAMRHA